MAANRKFIPEILAEINEDTSKITQYKDSSALKVLLPYAFLPEKKFDLPEGDPPFKQDVAPIGMSPGNFVQELRRLYIFTKERELPAVKREGLFINLLEALHPSEAKVLLAVKDQNLQSLYPNITVDLLVDNGLLPEEARAFVVPKVVRKRGRPAKNAGS